MENTTLSPEEATANLKEISVLPADIHLTSDNEQVLSGNYRIFGNEAQQKLRINVINNWMVSYCDHSNGLQSDTGLMPNWFTVLREDKLEVSKEFPTESSETLDKYEKKTEDSMFQKMWNEIQAKGDDNIEKELMKNPPKLSGVKRKKVCQVCDKHLPEGGKGSRKCLNCGEPWKTVQEEEQEKPKEEQRSLNR